MVQSGSRRRSKRPNRRRIFSRRAILLGSALTSAAAAAYLLLRPKADDRPLQTARPAATIGLQLAGPITAQNAGEIVASMKSHDLQILLRPGDANIDPIGEVTSGRSAFGITTGIQFMIARGKGAPIVVFGAEFLDSPVAFFALESSKINSPADFRGLRIPRQQGSETAIIYDAVLANLGISRGEIKERDAPGSLSMLLDRSIDVLPGEIAVTGYQLKKSGASCVAIRPADYGIHVPGSVYFTNERILRDHPSIAGAFLEQVISGWHKVYADEKSAAEMVAAAARVPNDQAAFELKARRDLVLPIERRIAEFDELQWKQLRIILLQERLIREDTDFSSAIDYSILKGTYRRRLSFGQ